MNHRYELRFLSLLRKHYRMYGMFTWCSVYYLLRGNSLFRYSWSVIRWILKNLWTSELSSFSYMLISPSKRSSIARTSCSECIFGSMTARVMNSFDLSSARSPDNHRLVWRTLCCKRTSEMIWIQHLRWTGRACCFCTFRKAEIKIMLSSVRFSTPFNLKTLSGLSPSLLPEDYI